MMTLQIFEGSARLSEFVNTRVAYLAQLSSIGSGWIAGGGRVEGVTPSVEVCKRAIELITDVASRPTHCKDLHAGSLLLGPLVDGGVAVEMRFVNHGVNIYVTLPNSGKTEVTLQRGEVFDEFELEWMEVLSLLDEALSTASVAVDEVSFLTF